NPESAYQLLEMQRSGVRVKPSDLRPNLPAQAEQIVLRGLSFDPKDRYARAREFGELLSDALLTDDEQTLQPAQARQRARNESNGEPDLQTAHVLFVDIVAYSRLVIDEQA